MSFDGLVTHAIVHELQRLVGGRITKIYQPGDAELVLHIRSQGQNHKLLLSAHPAYARVQFTDAPQDNPKEPPMFCMLMRKHSEGGIVEAIAQVDMERIIHFDFRSRDELGDEVTRRLVIEIMGRHSNIILVDPETQTIIDGIKRVSHAVSQHRQIYPGAAYVAPPAQDKKNPLEIDKQSFIAGFDYNSGRLDKQMVQRFTGLGPLTAKEIVHSAGVATRDRLWEAFHQVMEKAKRHDYVPTITKTADKSLFSLWPLTHVTGESKSYATMSECLEHFFYGKAERDRVRQQTVDLIRKLKNEIDKNEKKIAILTAELESAEQAETLRIYGELITAYMHQIKRGDTETKVMNYYDENAPEITIALDPLLTPSENAQRYFKKYNKLKAAKKWNVEQIAKAKDEKAYLESVLVQLENSTLRDVEQIREELEEQGWLKAQPKKQQRKKKEAPAPLSVQATDGTPILVGRNNKQNDYLTHQLAHATDTWLHTKDIPGSHVVIRSKTVSEQTLREAAILAAYYSKARESSQVPVDFTLVKHVKKPSGARPGFVIYEQQQTLYVTPDEEVVKRLLQTDQTGSK
ncbi:Rqc2 family fibronectin-binding protein [Laceyella putida]|uniref:Rqc2 homolog RqcH n=1 Tax=Laceyella putida TaxID=110101 RepID=A0ABW2RMV9_9BACL